MSALQSWPNRASKRHFNKAGREQNVDDVYVQLYLEDKFLQLIHSLDKGTVNVAYCSNYHTIEAKAIKLEPHREKHKT